MPSVCGFVAHKPNGIGIAKERLVTRAVRQIHLPALLVLVVLVFMPGLAIPGDAKPRKAAPKKPKTDSTSKPKKDTKKDTKKDQPEARKPKDTSDRDRQNDGKDPEAEAAGKEARDPKRTDATRKVERSRTARRHLLKTMRTRQRKAIRLLARDRVHDRARRRDTWWLRWILDGMAPRR